MKRTSWLVLLAALVILGGYSWIARAEDPGSSTTITLEPQKPESGSNDVAGGKEGVDPFEQNLREMRKQMDALMQNPFMIDPSLDKLRGFDSFHKGLDDHFRNLFDTFGKGFPLGRGGGIDSDSFRSDVREQGNSLVVTVDLPGHDKSSIDLRLKDDTLIIRSERKSQRQEAKDGKVYLNEIAEGRASRVISLPRKVIADQVKASYTNGVLTVTLPIDSSSSPGDEGLKVEIQ